MDNLNLMEKINKFKFKFNKIYYSLFKERFNKSINFDFPEILIAGI